jgi:glutathione S-transferase
VRRAPTERSRCSSWMGFRSRNRTRSSFTSFTSCGAWAAKRRHVQTGSARRLERELSARPFLLGDSITVAELSCSAYLFLAHDAGSDVATWPAVQRWLERIASHRGFRPIAELMSKPSR